MTQAEGYEVERQTIKGTPVKITSYQIGNIYYCHVANEDPGAVFVRCEGDSREQVLEAAIAKATERL